MAATRGMGIFYGRTLTAQRADCDTRIRVTATFRSFARTWGSCFRRDFRRTPASSSSSSRGNESRRKYGDQLDADVLMRTDLQTYLSENCLVKTDRASMLASLEVRVPFLDELLLDRILPLRADKKIVDGQLKALLLPIASACCRARSGTGRNMASTYPLE